MHFNEISVTSNQSIIVLYLNNLVILFQLIGLIEFGNHPMINRSFVFLATGNRPVLAQNRIPNKQRECCVNKKKAQKHILDFDSSCTGRPVLALEPNTEQ